jgi:oxygen-independent coproporphyrinogen-3 oxidase
VLDPEARRLEDILLRLRVVDGLDTDLLDPTGRGEAAAAADDGLLVADRLSQGRAVLTLQGRLLADGLALRLAD